MFRYNTIFGEVHYDRKGEYMIAFFPDAYEDELVYSWFARYYVRTGYTSYRAVGEDLFEKAYAKPSWEYYIKLTDDVKKIIAKSMTIEELIMKHTMFPAYARFLPRERRQKAFQLLVNMDKDFRNVMYMKRGPSAPRRWFRYCPLCVEKNRETWGETYWQRKHQIDGADICTIHKCRLVNSELEMSSKASPSLISAESIIPQNVSEIDYGVTEMELSVSKYIISVFEHEVDMEQDIEIGEFLNSKMEYTKYLSERGTRRKTEIIFKDYANFYKDFEGNPVQENGQLELVFQGNNKSMFEICLLSYFLGVSADELCKMYLPDIRQWEIYDSRVKELHANGLNYMEIAKEMNTSYDVVKLVGKGKYEK